MMDEATLERLTGLLWPHGDRHDGPQVYWLLDGARDPAIAALVRGGKLEHACLYAGELHPRLQAAAPYLVHLSARSPGTDRLLRSGWGNAWGILLAAPPDASLARLRLYFKKLLRVCTGSGEQLLFRYYDPRVLNVYLPTCTADEAKSVFGPVIRFVTEDSGGAGMRVFEAGQGQPGRIELAPDLSGAAQGGECHGLPFRAR